MSSNRWLAAAAVLSLVVAGQVVTQQAHFSRSMPINVSTQVKSPSGTGRQFELTRRFYAHFLNYDDQHDEANWRPVERRLAFDVDRSALILVDVWNTNEISFERIDRIVRERIRPLVEACRKAGILVVHAPSPPVADKYPKRRFRPSPPEAWVFHRPSDGWPTAEMKARSGPFAKYSLSMEDPNAWKPKTQEEWYRNYLIHPTIEPAGDDVVVGDREELHALLKARGKFHLFYAGFASNGCVQDRDYGVRLVSYLGYDLTLIRDCSAGLEMAHTVGTLEQTRASIENMEYWISTASSKDLMGGLLRMQQAGGQQGKPLSSRVSKRRRIIVNDDGEPLLREKSPEAFLTQRFSQTAGTQVDTYIIYVGDGWHPHRGRKTDPGLGDPYRVIVDAAHRQGMEIFASLRMNDIHSSWDGSAGPLKRKRPDLLIGEAYAFQQYPHLLEGEKGEPLGGYPQGVMRAFWSGFNFAKSEVRELRRARVEEVAKAYDFDGFELDFLRAPLFFKPGEERENLDAMTTLVRDIRRTLRDIGGARGRPYLLAVRVPDTPSMALRTGLDVKRWLDEGLVDVLMVGGGYLPFSTRIKEMIDMAHLHDIPAYPVVDIDAYAPGSPPHDWTFSSHFEPDKMRAIASNFLCLGSDGVYLFNWYGLPPSPSRNILSPIDVTKQLALLTQLGDIETLRHTPKRFLPDNGSSISYCGYVNAPQRFPVRLIDGAPVELVVGDDLEKTSKDGKLASLDLRIEVASMHIGEGINLSINGTPISPDDVRRADERTFQVKLKAPPLQQGVNQVVVLPGRASVGRMSSQITWLELSVAYQ